MANFAPGMFILWMVACCAAADPTTYSSTVAGKAAEIPAADARATVLIFVSSTCPIANGYALEVNRLQKDYGGRGIQFALVHTERELTAESAREHLNKFKYECPVLLDPERKLVAQTEVTITPEAAVLSPKGELLYRGRIDDRFPEIGIQREQPTKTDLRDALEALLAGRRIAVTRTKAVGCLIE